ncbi:MAG: hypothetical protein M3R38_09510 [Actinomycetota bacterium]|nr:hypothetical protein [Actinomycetota bacterium]
MAGLEEYYSRDLAELEDVGAPVDRAMFAELIAAEGHLGEPQPTSTETREVEVEPSLTIETTTSHGSRREGFEGIRDAITKHRRAWAEEHLQEYLRKRAENDVREVAKVFHTKSAERGGKPPTPKQFAKAAAVPANRWFGGDVAALYRAFGERSPVSPVRVRVVPVDVEGFVARVYRALGGVEVTPSPKRFDRASMEEHSREVSDNHNKVELAHKALEYLHLEETLGRAPTLKEFGRSSFEHRAGEAGLGAEVEATWTQYELIVRGALTGTGGAPCDDGKQGHGAGRAQHDERPHEANESPAKQLGDQDNEARSPRQPFDTATQRPTDGEQEKSWWRSLFGR